MGEVKGILVKTQDLQEGWTNVKCEEQSDKLGECGAVRKSREGTKAGMWAIELNLPPQFWFLFIQLGCVSSYLSYKCICILWCKGKRGNEAWV